MEAKVQLAPERPVVRTVRGLLRPDTARYVGAVLALALAYYGTAKLAQSLRYTASVSAVWPPAGLGIAALYLWGLRLWPVSRGVCGTGNTRLGRFRCVGYEWYC